MSSRNRSCSSPAIVALTTLDGLLEPSDLLKTSLIPTDSSTARTVLPAIRPVPGEAGVIKAALGNAANQRHLAAFKPNANRTAGTGCLALSAASAGLAVAAGFPLAEAFAAMLGTRTRFEIV